MAAWCNDDGLQQLSNEMCFLSINEVRFKELGLDEKTRAKLNKIVDDYESIFSWDIKRLTGISQNRMADLVNVVQEKYELIAVKDNVFNINRFFLGLINCFENYVNGNYEKSLLKIQTIDKFMETCKFEDSRKQLYSNAYKHIVRATNAYISLTLNLDSEKIMKDVKPANSLNKYEKSAICAIKCRVFMEYPPIGNDIGLTFAEQARNLHSTEPDWILIWLKAKGRVRRYKDTRQMPDEHEIDAANILSEIKGNPQTIIQAAILYKEVAMNHKINQNPELSKQFYQLSSDLSYKAIELAGNDIKLLRSCLLNCVECPKMFHSKTILNNVIKILSGQNHSHIDQALGKYYLVHNDYQKAKMHLARAMASGHFNSAMLLVKVECLLQTIDRYPFVNTLNMICQEFPSPKRRLIVISQILFYYCLIEQNPKELMRYLQIYMDQDIDDKIKRHHLITAYPLFKTTWHFRMKTFLNILSSEVKHVKSHYKWTAEEKITIYKTYDQFNDIISA